jgi:glycine dehydrogenase subunit 1
VELAGQCATLANYARDRVCAIPGVTQAFDAPFFNEFAVRLPVEAAEAVGRLIEHGIAAGFPVGRYYPGLENVLLIAVTEKRTREDIDLLAARLAAAVH